MLKQIAQRRHKVVPAHDFGAHGLRRHPQRPAPDQRRRHRLLVHVHRLGRLSRIPQPVMAQQRAACRSEDHDVWSPSFARRVWRAPTAPRRPSRVTAARVLPQASNGVRQQFLPGARVGGGRFGIECVEFRLRVQVAIFLRHAVVRRSRTAEVHGGEERLAGGGRVDHPAGAARVRAGVARISGRRQHRSRCPGRFAPERGRSACWRGSEQATATRRSDPEISCPCAPGGRGWACGSPCCRRPETHCGTLSAINNRIFGRSGAGFLSGKGGQRKAAEEEMTARNKHG